MPLLRSRRLWPLLVTQGLGAINDNMFKNALVVLVLFRASAHGPALVAAAGGVFIAPYVLLSATAGQIADKWDKARLIRLVKWWELALMALAAAGLLMGSVALMFAVLFGLGVQATFFSPLKYGILPDHLTEAELVAGNGLLEAGTFIGILAGTIAGSALVALPGGPAIVSAAGLVFAAGGVASAYCVPPAPPSAVGLRVRWNVARETAGLLRIARANRMVWRCLLGISWFWLLGATVLAELPTLVRALGGDAGVVSLMLAVFSLGVGTGSVLAGRVLRGVPALWPVPWAALGLAVFLGDFCWAASGAAGLADPVAVVGSVAGQRMLVDLLLLAACGGLYSVPLYAMLQDRSAPAERARMVAANNVVNAVAIVGGAVMTAVAAVAGVGPVGVLAVAAGVGVGVAGLAMWR